MTEHVSHSNNGITHADPTSPAEVFVPIADAFWDAQRVPFDRVNVGDSVFDAFGGRHVLTKARVLKSGALSIKRADYPTEHIPPGPDGATITIVRAHGWSDKAVQYHGGEFHYTCRCGEVFTGGQDDDGTGAAMALAEHANTTNGYEEF